MAAEVVRGGLGGIYASHLRRRNVFGHDLEPPPLLDTDNHLRIPTGVTHLMPVRVGDEVVYISEFGGLGIAKAERVELKNWANRTD